MESIAPTITFASLINGKSYHTQYAESVAVSSPIDGKTIYRIAEADQEIIDAALMSADKAQKKWRLTSTQQRAALLRKIATIIQENAHDLAKDEAIDTGKKFSNALNEIKLAVDYFHYFAASILTQEEGAAVVENILSINLAEPLGKIGIILPWNFPLLMFSWKVAPALAAGNVVILKPSEYACLSIMKCMMLIRHILPRGVLNIILGRGNTTGKLMTKTLGFDKFIFTGGIESGKHIATTLAEQLVPYTLELGGKSPCIVTKECLNKHDQFFDDLMQTLLSFTYHQGQVCGNLSRLIIDKTIYNQVIDKISQHLSTYKIGDPRNPKMQMGPIISLERKQVILNYLESAKKNGCRISEFGAVSLDESTQGGFYLPAYLVEGNYQSPIYQEELFAPILCLSSFSSLEEAIQIANSSRYGLTASVWSRNHDEANYLTKNIIAGKIWVNTSHIYYPHTKFGGVKHSGTGNEMHCLALRDYQYIKNSVQPY
ncbi:MAG: aldehyde dehydrogenase family protein [Pseudomonadota bacterium]